MWHWTHRCGGHRFEWRVNSNAGSAGASIRATRWLSEAHLKVGDLKVTALFIAPVERAPGDGLNAGCLRLDEPVRPAQDAPLSFEGSPVRE